MRLGRTAIGIVTLATVWGRVADPAAAVHRSTEARAHDNASATSDFRPLLFATLLKLTLFVLRIVMHVVMHAVMRQNPHSASIGQGPGSSFRHGSRRLR